MKKLYKIIVHNGSKCVFEFEIKSISKTTITYFVGLSDTTKRLNKEKLDTLEVYETTHDIILNPVVIFTLDKSMIETYKHDCNEIYIKRIQEDLNRRVEQLEKFKKMDWRFSGDEK